MHNHNNKLEKEPKQSIHFDHLINSSPNHLFFNYENMKMGNPVLNSCNTSNKMFMNSVMASGYDQDFEDNSFSHNNNQLNSSAKYYNDFSDSASANNIPNSPLINYQFPKTNSFLKRSEFANESKKNLPSLDEQCQSEDSRMFNLDNLELQTLNQSDYNGLYDQQDRQTTLNVLPDTPPFNFIHSKVNSYNANNLMSPSITDKNSLKFNFDGSVYSGQGVFSPAKRTSNEMKSNSMFNPQNPNKPYTNHSVKNIYMNNNNNNQNLEAFRNFSMSNRQVTPPNLYKNKKLSLQLNCIKEKNELSHSKNRAKGHNSKLNTISEKNHTNTHESSSPSNNKIGTFRSFDEEQNTDPIIPHPNQNNQNSVRKISFGSKQEESQQIFQQTKIINPKSFNNIKNKRNNFKTKSFNTTNPIFYTPKIKKSPLNLSEDPSMNLKTIECQTEVKKKNLKIRLKQNAPKMAQSMVNLSPIINNDSSFTKNKNNFFEEFDNESLYRKNHQDNSQWDVGQEHDERARQAHQHNYMLAQFNEYKLMKERGKNLSKAQSESQTVQHNNHPQFMYNQNQIDPYKYRKISEHHQQMENPFLYPTTQTYRAPPHYYQNYPPNMYQHPGQWQLQNQTSPNQQPAQFQKPPITQEYVEYLQNKQRFLEAQLAQQVNANSNPMMSQNSMPLQQPQFPAPINQFYQHQQINQELLESKPSKSNEKTISNKKKKNKRKKKKKNYYK